MLRPLRRPIPSQASGRSASAVGTLCGKNDATSPTGQRCSAGPKRPRFRSVTHDESRSIDHDFIDSEIPAASATKAGSIAIRENSANSFVCRSRETTIR